MTPDNKDYIFNLRLSKDTVEKLKKTAKENGETASHLARKILHDGLDFCQDLKGDLFNDGNKSKKDLVVHSYEVILHQEEVCSETKKKLKKGQKAVIGETKTGKKYIFHPSVFPKKK